MVTLTSAQKTASSSSVKTILGKTFAGSPVNACILEPQSILLEFNKNKYFSRTRYTQGFHTVLISNICSYFESLHLGKYHCSCF